MARKASGRRGKRCGTKWQPHRPRGRNGAPVGGSTQPAPKYSDGILATSGRGQSLWCEETGWWRRRRGFGHRPLDPASGIPYRNTQVLQSRQPTERGLVCRPTPHNNATAVLFRVACQRPRRPSVSALLLASSSSWSSRSNSAPQTRQCFPLCRASSAGSRGEVTPHSSQCTNRNLCLARVYRVDADNCLSSFC
jgi:hypothetical protein